MTAYRVYVATYSFRKAELKTFLQFHKEGTEPLRDDEVGSHRHAEMKIPG
jgi:hypothetical protein